MHRSPGHDRSGRWRSLSRRAVVGGVALLLLGVALSAVAAPVALVEHAQLRHSRADAAPVVLNVTATDAPAFDPRALSAIAGSTVTFVVDNTGSFAHTFSLTDRANESIPAGWTPSQLDQYFEGNGSTVNLTVGPGTTANVTFPVPGSWAGGSFEFVSLVPYQFQAGMSGYLNVTGASAGAGYAIQVVTAASGLAFVPAAIEIGATSFPIRVTANVSNQGTVAHTWTLDATPNENLTASGFTSTFQAHPPAANVIVPTTSGQVATANFTLTQKGVYEFICTVPGHFQAGMFGYLYVGVPAPAPAVPPSTAVVQVGVLVAAGALLGIGVLLAVIAAYTGRFTTSQTGPRHR